MTDPALVTQLPLWTFPLNTAKTLEKQPDLHTLSQCRDYLPDCVTTSPTLMRCLELLGPLDWADFPERDLQRNWGQVTIPYVAFVAAELIRLNEALPSMGRLRRYLIEHPGFIWLLGFPVQRAPETSLGFNPQASLPTSRHLTHLLRQIPNDLLQFLLADCVRLILAELQAQHAPTIEKLPRKVMLMVKAGKPVDDFIELLIPHLQKGDLIIDGGNSHYPDTTRRTKYLEGKGLLYIGTGVSGGEEGALKDPSIMPGGSVAAWPHVKPIFQAIAAKVEDGTPCCDWVGENGAGHFVKMVHNGIEYGDMQLICEAYQLMKDLLGLSYDEMYNVFKEWNEGELDSYLIEITRDILNYRENGKPLVEYILDKAGQKGTGKWTSQNALDVGAPIPTINAAVESRLLPAADDDRETSSRPSGCWPTPRTCGCPTARCSSGGSRQTPA